MERIDAKLPNSGIIHPMDLDHVPANARAGLNAMNAKHPLTNVDKGALASKTLQRYIDGTPLETIAQELKVSRGRLYQILVEHDPDGWRQAKTAQTLVRYDDALNELRDAPDGLELNRAREVIRTAQWHLERVCRRIYGQDAPAVQINVNLGDVSERIRELERELLGNAAALSVDKSGSADSV